MKEILHGKTIKLLTQSKQQMNFGNDQNSRFKFSLLLYDSTNTAGVNENSAPMSMSLGRLDVRVLSVLHCNTSWVEPEALDTFAGGTLVPAAPGFDDLSDDARNFREKRVAFVWVVTMNDAQWRHVVVSFFAAL